MKLERLHPNEDNIVKCKPTNPDACYVKGRLQPTRALGDLYLKYAEFNGPSATDRTRGRHIPAPYTPPYITAEPEVIRRPANTNDQFMVIACDGLWDVMSNQEVVDFVSSYDGQPQDISDALITEALRKAAEENKMTLNELLAIRQGKRRKKHDDLTVIVVNMGK